MDNYDKWFYSSLDKKEQDEIDARVMKCSYCDEWVHQGERYLELDDVDILCEYCIDKIMRIA